jgi:LysR family hydrogen peroxide-inducible transcriptional activator
MEIHQIRYFLAVHATGSFTQGAHQTHVSQPSLSAQISKLEQELGGPLFYRSRKEVRLTERGEVFLPRAREILHQVEQANLETRELDGLTRGTVRLGCLPTTGAFLLPDLLGDFHNQYPNIQVQLVEESSPGLAQALDHFQVELAIMDEAGLGPGLTSTPLFTEPLYLAVPPDHPLANHRAIDLSVLHDEPMILMKPGHGFHTIVMNALQNAGVEPIVVYQSAEIETVQGLVGAGLGISLVPKMVRKAWGISYLEILPPTPSRTIHLAYRERGFLGTAASALKEIAIERLCRLG